MDESDLVAAAVSRAQPQAEVVLRGDLPLCRLQGPSEWSPSLCSHLLLTEGTNGCCEVHRGLKDMV
jgi:hypothetical protein